MCKLVWFGVQQWCFGVRPWRIETFLCLTTMSHRFVAFCKTFFKRFENMTPSDLKTCQCKNWQLCDGWTPVSLPRNDKAHDVTPAFPLGRVAEAADAKELEMPHDQQQSLLVMLVPHRDGSNPGRKCRQLFLDRHPGRFRVGAVSRLVKHFQFRWHDRTTVTEISVWRRGAAFRVLRISQLRTLSRSVTPWTLR